MGTTVDRLCVDLLAERGDTLAVLSGLSADRWAWPTAAWPWTVTDQVVHLAWFDDAAVLAIEQPERFHELRAGALDDIDGFVDSVRREHGSIAPDDAIDWLRSAGAELTAAARGVPRGTRVPWFGPDMSIESCLTARIMETWAHGRDIADAVGVTPEPTERLVHVAFLGVRALPNSFRAHGLPVPTDPVRVELVAPNGDHWTFGPSADEVVNIVRGLALDFCLLATQRCHRADTELVAIGEVADRWLDVIQAFAGPPGSKREPRAARVDTKGGIA